MSGGDWVGATASPFTFRGNNGGQVAIFNHVDVCLAMASPVEMEASTEQATTFIVTDGVGASTTRSVWEYSCFALS
jgi:hypothetical protein